MVSERALLQYSIFIACWFLQTTVLKPKRADLLRKLLNLKYRSVLGFLSLMGFQTCYVCFIHFKKVVYWCFNPLLSFLGDLSTGKLGLGWHSDSTQLTHSSSASIFLFFQFRARSICSCDALLVWQSHSQEILKLAQRSQLF